ncbi:uncharacterized protein DUF3606 [Arcticibacter pallidicorallinus]|uniref:Uncharacterized protein DUF3606 n=1 Tax=Arcticibacter pallidicorallinus TaxID=1259464 RepID=A0A2T0U3D8_9SPHI|nr:DUF3606 domain-containing protein [Arcticibacter pallidicorallinus]PRY52429.1 uncharacterized protein DUF3606 [Arcticibacter pallidicorallinus]
MTRANIRYSEKMLISIHIEEDLNYWANKWGVSRESIKSAVKASRSNSISSVQEYLLKNKQISELAD